MRADEYDHFAATLDADIQAHARPARFIPIGAAEVLKRPPPAWAVRSVFPSQGLGGIYGPTGSGKSFLEIDLVASMAESMPWFGHGVDTEHRVVVLVLEGEGGFRNRIAAWEIARGRTFPTSVKFIFEPFNLLEGADVEDLANSIALDGGTDVLVVDTLNRATPGADENSSRDASLMLKNLKWLQQTLGGLVLVIHHTGKDETRGMRGHSSLIAAMDAAIEVRRTADRREWSVAKSKDDVDGQVHAFMLERITLPDDSTGFPVTSCVIQLDDAPVDNTPRPPNRGNQRIIYDALGPLFRASTAFGKAGAPATRPCLDLEEIIPLIKDRLPVEPRRQPERTRLAINGMVANRILGFSEGWIWLV